MYKFVCFLTALVYCTNALGVEPLELSSCFSEIVPRRDPSTSTYYLLPNATVPVRYDIHITTNIDKGVFDFDGKVQIYLQAMQQVDRIVIHKRQLTIGATSLIWVQMVNNSFVEVGNRIQLKDSTYDETTEFLTIPLYNDTLRWDEHYKLEINYSGTLRGSKAGGNQRDFGFYRSSYIDANNQTKWLAATNFEPHDARHAFPCYDEPALKAKFNIQLKYGSCTGYTAISNMPEKNTTTEGTYRITTFEETPVMSTYLIAFVVSDFEYIANFPENETDETKVLQRVFGTPARQDQLVFTLEAGVKILEKLDEYLNVSYIDTLPKMDQIGLPDFPSGAMENWGLVTYAEGPFYYSNTSSLTQKNRIAKLVAHEFAHQWFGNLVTPEWWKYIWLNEGFATVFEYYIPNMLYPEYQALDYFTIQVCQRVFITDSVSDIRPMTFDAYSPSEVSALFDRIAYAKAGCVITMIMHAMGENAFRAGLTKYLIARKGNYANPEHLFTALQTEASTSGTIPTTLTINGVFRKWSTQRGFPILKVTFSTTNKAITLQQEAFLTDKLTDPQKLIWDIPYNFITNEELSTSNNEDTTTFGWLNEASKVITPTAERNWNTSNWVLFNKKLTGYYRVTYDIDNWNAIISYVANANNAKNIHYLNRAQLLGDAMNIARANRLSYNIPLRLAQNMMKHETSYFTWTPFINNFNFLEQILFDTNSHSKLLKLAVEAGTAAYNHYKIYENVTDKYYDTITRYKLVNFMCKVGFSKCHEDTTAALINYLKNNLTVSNYLKPAILQNGLRNANSTIFQQVWELIMTNRAQADRSTFIAGLGLTNYAVNIQTLLHSVLIENNKTYCGVVINYSASERNTILTTIASSKVTGFKSVLEFLKTNASTIMDIYGKNTVTVFSTLASRTSSTATLTQLSELMVLYKNYDDNKRFVDYTATAKQNIAWNAGAGASISAPLDYIYPDNSAAASSFIVSTVVYAAAIIFTRFMS